MCARTPLLGTELCFVATVKDMTNRQFSPSSVLPLYIRSYMANAKFRLLFYLETEKYRVYSGLGR